MVCLLTIERNRTTTGYTIVDSVPENTRRSPHHRLRQTHRAGPPRPPAPQLDQKRPNRGGEDLSFPHDLRHGAASLAHEAGADLKTLQDLLGHSSILVTADTYTSVLPQPQRRCADANAHLVLTAAHHT